MPFARVNSQFEPLVVLRSVAAYANRDLDRLAGREDPAERDHDRLVVDRRLDRRAGDGDGPSFIATEPGGDRVQLEPVDRVRPSRSGRS